MKNDKQTRAKSKKNQKTYLH